MQGYDDALKLRKATVALIETAVNDAWPEDQPTPDGAVLGLVASVIDEMSVDSAFKVPGMDDSYLKQLCAEVRAGWGLCMPKMQCCMLMQAFFYSF